MENKPTENAFEEVHRKSRAFREGLRKRSDQRAPFTESKALEEATQNGFDRSAIEKPYEPEVEAPEPEITK